MGVMPLLSKYAVMGYRLMVDRFSSFMLIKHWDGEWNGVVFYWNASDLRSNTRTFWLLLTTNYNRHNRLFSNSIHASRSHCAADDMLLLQIWRRGVQWSTEVIYVASICLFGWFRWVFGGGKSVMSIPGIQACSAFQHDVASICCRFLQRIGFTRKWFAHPIRQNGIERKGA